MRAYVVIGSAALALAACQKAGNTGGSGATATTPTPAATSSGLPTRRAGLWQQTISRQGASGPMNAMGGMKICIDATTESKGAAFARNMGQGRGDSPCPPPTISRGLDGNVTYAMTCQMGEGGTMTSKGTMSGDMSSAYHVHVETDVTGSQMPSMNGHRVTEIDGKWLGPCPTGMAGGDVQLPNGMTVNASRFAGAAKAMGGGQ